jgi:hypothetical protein
MSVGRGRQHRLFRGLMLKLGIEPPDSAFNRRAKEYSRQACKLEAASTNMARRRGVDWIDGRKIRNK